jgi:dihydroorotase
MESDASVVLRNCRLFGRDSPVDIAVGGGRIAAVAPGLKRASRQIECEGAYVTPAWVDSHVHLRSAATPGRIDALEYGPKQGVGALVDAGSAPPDRIDDLLAAGPWVFALANIDSRGIRGDPNSGPEISGAAADRALRRDPERVRGIKVQASQSVLGSFSLEAIRNAIRVAESHDVPVMVHVGNPPPALEAVCDLLRPGDVITHYAHGKPEGATLAGGSVLPAIRRAWERGVRLDVGHGRSSFSFRRFRELAAAGILPWSISTDLHASSAEAPVVSLARTMSKMVALGMSDAEVIDAVTTRPSRAFRLGGMPGSVAAGEPARLTLFRLEDAAVETEDSLGKKLVCKRWFRPIGCLFDGDWHPVETPL